MFFPKSNLRATRIIKLFPDPVADSITPIGDTDLCRIEHVSLMGIFLTLSYGVIKNGGH